MSKFFVNHPIPAIVLSIILTLVGTLSAINLPIAEYPDIAPPTVSVSTSYIGADASVVNNTVAQIIEQEINGVDDIEFMNSTVDTSGNYDLSIVFKQGTDIDIAAVRVQNKISSVLSDLPAEVQSQGVSVNKNTPESVLRYTAPKNGKQNPGPRLNKR
ncbi:MAG: efflux RND transporter permease subunit [Selenomonadaceae bacterium]|nr:efflux RND transporter permease subunit [Selenomonadaceae bacterium]